MAIRSRDLIVVPKALARRSDMYRHLERKTEPMLRRGAWFQIAAGFPLGWWQGALFRDHDS
jgi:hypothetical protein